MSNEFEEIQNRLASWQSDTELNALGELKQQLDEIPEELLGKSTSDFTEPMKRYVGLMYDRHALLQKLYDWYTRYLQGQYECTYQHLQESNIRPRPGTDNTPRVSLYTGELTVYFKYENQVNGLWWYWVSTSNGTFGWIGLNTLGVCDTPPSVDIDESGNPIVATLPSTATPSPTQVPTVLEGTFVLNRGTDVYDAPNRFGERANPILTAEGRILTLEAGTEVEVIDSSDRFWVHVRFELNGEMQEGWIYVGRLEPENFIITQESTTIRLSPTDDANFGAILAVVPSNTTLILTGDQITGWQKVLVQINGTVYEGWIASSTTYIDTVEDSLPNYTDAEVDINRLPVPRPHISYIIDDREAWNFYFGDDVGLFDDLDRDQRILFTVTRENADTLSADLLLMMQILDNEASRDIQQLIDIAFTVENRMRNRSSSGFDMLTQPWQYSAYNPDKRGLLVSYGQGTATDLPGLENYSRDTMLLIVTQALAEGRPLDETLASMGLEPSNEHIPYGAYTIGFDASPPYTEGETPSRSFVLQHLQNAKKLDNPNTPQDESEEFACNQTLNRDPLLLGVSRVGPSGLATAIFSASPECDGL